MKNKISMRNESTVQEVNIVIPPDGGYAWVIVVAAFMSNFIVDGITFSFGTSMLPELSEVLKLPKSKVAVVSSAQLGVYYLVGPIVCAFVNRFGFRAVGIYGCVVSFAGIFVASYIESFSAIVALYGVIGGIGFGMIYTSSIISVGYYFEKYRALSTGIAVCGSSVGGLCLSHLFTYLVNTTGWAMTMKIQSCLMVVCLLTSLTYRPLKPTSVPLTPEIINEIDNASTHARTPSRVEFVELYQTHTMESIALDTPSEESRRHFPQISIISSRFLPISEMQRQKRKCFSWSYLQNLCAKCLGEESDEKPNVIPTGPLDRKDIFYSASVANLPEYKMMKQNESVLNTKPMLSYHLSMIIDPKTMQLSTHDQIVAEPENTTRCLGVSRMIQNALGKLFDVSLLKSSVFCIIALACFFYALAWMTPYVFLPVRGAEDHISQTYINWYVSCISIGNAVGRITSGTVATAFPQINSCYMVGYATISAGVITIISSLTLLNDANFQIIYCVILGFCIAFLSALRPIVVVKLLGLDKLTNAFGLSAIVIGTGVLSGTPIASALLEKTESLMPAFVVSGSFFILSGSLIILAFHVYGWEERRKITKK